MIRLPEMTFLAAVAGNVVDEPEGLNLWVLGGSVLLFLAIVVAITLSSLTLPSWLARTAAYGIALFAVWYVLLRVPTRERVLAERVSWCQD
jgi:hypothetical protein